MNRSSILAHRGWFLADREKNSKSSLVRALDNGYGLETDVRDLNGRLVISHDPPTEESEHLPLSWLFEQILQCENGGRVALNVKADGLSKSIAELVERFKIDSTRIYVFDMSVPDSLAYYNSCIPVYTRISEYEERPALLEKAVGVWVDDFTGAFPQVQRAEHLLGLGLRTALVSSELHGRNNEPLWEAILLAGLHRHPLFELCTDFPSEAARLFCNPEKIR